MKGGREVGREEETKDRFNMKIKASCVFVQ